MLPSTLICTLLICTLRFAHHPLISKGPLAVTPIIAVMALGLLNDCFGQDTKSSQLPPFVEIYRGAAFEKWQHDIEKLEKLGTPTKTDQQKILFIGSSSIRRWDSIEEQMQPWLAIQRGYGGAKFSDLAIFADRLIQPHDYSGLVIFVANDIAGSKQDKQPAEVLQLLKFIVSRAQEHKPDAPIFVIEITPTSKRWKAWPNIKKLNALIENYCSNHSKLHFIATAEHYLTKDGSPNEDLFVADKLHLNDQGYKIWEQKIKQALSAVLGPVDAKAAR